MALALVLANAWCVTSCNLLPCAPAQEQAQNVPPCHQKPAAPEHCLHPALAEGTATQTFEAAQFEAVSGLEMWSIVSPVEMLSAVAQARDVSPPRVLPLVLRV